ncbi:MAG TPA: phosphoribosylformylglycinamidine synthase [Candidatus Hydrogenedentes bacterium]|nr:phosphoribosylformylglycinamidine synthase [Candidatus Hydrogenedentota bacterium]
MPINRIEVAMKPTLPDPAGEALRVRVREDLGITFEVARVIDVFILNAALREEELEKARCELFTDPIIQTSAINQSLATDYDCVIEVGFLPGVTDNVGRSSLEGVQDTLGRPLAKGEAVYKSTLYALKGVDKTTAETIAAKLLANELIEQYVVKTADEMKTLDGKPLLALPIVTQQSDAEVHEVSLELSDDALAALSREKMLALDLDEMRSIRNHYNHPDTRARRGRLGLPAAPTDIELEILAQTWSEHCKHKIFNATITYIDEHGDKHTIDGLFKTYIKGVTDAVSKRVPWLVNVFEDNAGIIQFDDDHVFALKAETHNSPSALDPYGGAMTGIVGVNRDVLGAGLGFQCIFNTDVFCFASPFYKGEIPPRLLHPKRVLRGVHSGVRDGGNQSGIPDVNGAIVFHERFLGKPLVFCGTGGLSPAVVGGRPAHKKAAKPGDHIVMTGGRIGKDGIHGATFSSEALHEGSPATAVQIGDPITQKKMADFLLEARDQGLFNCITDCGAGGLSSSVGEMAHKPGGASIYLDKAPLKYAGLAPWEIFLSEAQERMTLAVPPEHLDAFLDLARRREVEATVLGEYNNSGFLDCYYNGKLIGSLNMEFLHEGLPKMRLEAQLNPPEPAAELLLPSDESDLTSDLLQVLGALNVCSKESFVRMYDHEVLGLSVLKQFQGARRDGPGNSGVIAPVPGSKRGIAVSCGICPKYSDLDAYRMAACAVDEAVRNLVAVGGKLGTIAGLDNFCWPDPVQSASTPDGRHKLAQLVRACEALYDVCLAYDIPLISGKDSMKNDYRIGDTKISIPPTILFTAAAIIEDVGKVVSMDAKAPGHSVYVLGETRDEMGGSEYLALRGQLGVNAPEVRPFSARALYERLGKAIKDGLVASCHDCSDGGLGVALAETAFAGDMGMTVTLSPLGVDNGVIALFSESQSRFVVTVSPDNAAAFEATLDGHPCYRVGETSQEPVLRIVCADGRKVESDLDALRAAWKQPLNW